MASGKHHAYIAEVEGQFKVHPPVATLEAGKKFSIRNMTSFAATVTIESSLAKPGTPHSQVLRPKASIVFELGKRNGFYPYEVWLDLQGRNLLRVNGGSDPVIIIDP